MRQRRSRPSSVWCGASLAGAAKRKGRCCIDNRLLRLQSSLLSSSYRSSPQDDDRRSKSWLAQEDHRLDHHRHPCHLRPCRRFRQLSAGRVFNQAGHPLPGPLDIPLANRQQMMPSPTGSIAPVSSCRPMSPTRLTLPKRRHSSYPLLIEGKQRRTATKMASAAGAAAEVMAAMA